MNKQLTVTIQNLTLKSETAEFPGGTVEGLASTFGNVDLQGEVMKRGAFKESVKEFKSGKKGLPLMDNHQLFSSVTAAIGKVIELDETPEGLFFKAFFSTDASAQAVRTRIREGILDSLSIGFSIIKKTLRKDGILELTEVKLREISIVIFPANVLARVAASKRRLVVKGLLAEARDVLDTYKRGRRRRQQRDGMDLDKRLTALEERLQKRVAPKGTVDAPHLPCPAVRVEQDLTKLRGERARQRRVEAQRRYNLSAGM